MRFPCFLYGEEACTLSFHGEWAGEKKLVFEYFEPMEQVQKQSERTPQQLSAGLLCCQDYFVNLSAIVDAQKEFGLISARK